MWGRRGLLGGEERGKKRACKTGREEGRPTDVRSLRIVMAVSCNESFEASDKCQFFVEPEGFITR